MNDEELRQLIRAAIQKHMGTGAPATAAATGADFARELPGEVRPDRLSSLPLSISFGQYQLERPSGDSACLIEPAVQCNHCGFCKCHGH